VPRDSGFRERTSCQQRSAKKGDGGGAVLSSLGRPGVVRKNRGDWEPGGFRISVSDGALSNQRKALPTAPGEEGLTTRCAIAAEMYRHVRAVTRMAGRVARHRLCVAVQFGALWKVGYLQWAGKWACSTLYEPPLDRTRGR
jgi:hypothetical protein